MEGPAASTWMQNEEAEQATNCRTDVLPAPRPVARPAGGRPRAWGDLGLVLILVGLALCIRTWLICHTEVAARDSIGFIRYAIQLERQPWTDVVRNSQQHPGYPAVLLAVSWPVRAIAGGTNAESMQLSAQLASSLAGILLVIPMFFLGRELFDRRAGFWGTLLFQCLPVSSRVLSDGLSEATFLLIITTALVVAVRAMRGRSVFQFALSGLCGGLAYLTRPEGALVVLATGLALLGMQAVPGWRRPWGRCLACGLALGLTALLAGSPYFLVTGHFTCKPTPAHIMGMVGLQQNQGDPQELHVPLTSAGTTPARDMQRRAGSASGDAGRRAPVLASLLAIYAPEDLTDKRWWGVRAIVTEVVKGYQYVIGLPVLVGLWWFRDRLRNVPGSWVVFLLCLLHAIVLWRLASVMGYVSDRHVLVLVLCGTFTGAASVARFGEWLAERFGRRSTPGQPAPRPWLALVLLLTMTGFGIADALKSLHSNRAGHRAAGLWLAQNTIPADPVIDPFCWASYYAGRLFWEGIEPPRPIGYRPTRYVVLEQSGQEHGRLPTISDANALARQGKIVYHWPVDKLPADAKVVIFAVAQP